MEVGNKKEGQKLGGGGGDSVCIMLKTTMMGSRYVLPAQDSSTPYYTCPRSRELVVPNDWCFGVIHRHLSLVGLKNRAQGSGKQRGGN